MNAELQRICDRYQAELAKVDAPAAQLHPGGDPERWSIQQIVEHLLLTYRATGAALEKRLAKGTVTRVRPTTKQLLLKTMVLGFRRMPKGVKAPEMVIPLAGAHPDCCGQELAVRMTESLAAMDLLLNEGEKRFGAAPIQQHFLFGPLTAHQWRRFHAIHASHHLRQIRRILTTE
jgi:Protein of unknown function (DUF1569)